jgi:hypothetical protein
MVVTEVDGVLQSCINLSMPVGAIHFIVVLKAISGNEKKGWQQRIIVASLTN